jgi:DNA-binding CsgD family transcriptional regulator
MNGHSRVGSVEQAQAQAPTAVAAPERRGWRDPVWQSHALFAAVAIGGVLGLWQLTRDRHPRREDFGADYYWPLWFALLWALLVLLHYLHAVGRLSLPAWPRRQVRRAEPVSPAEPPAAARAAAETLTAPPPVPFATGPASAAGPASAGEQSSAAASTPPHQPDRRALDQLTAREREVLALVAGGCANKEIARRLSISERTARTHVSNILRKLVLSSRTQAALVAVRTGLTEAAP